MLPKKWRIKQYLLHCTNKDDNSSKNFAELFQNSTKGKRTLILIKGSHGKCFGAFSDIAWTADMKDIYAHKTWNGNSFIFAQNPHYRDAMLLKSKQKGPNSSFFTKYRVREGQDEVYHSVSGPNFNDLKVNGPNEISKLICHGKHYNLPVTVVSDKGCRVNYCRGQIIDFKYETIEVF